MAMNIRDEDKSILSKPVELPGSEDSSRMRYFKTHRSISIPFKKIGMSLLAIAAAMLVSFGGYNLYKSSQNKPDNSASVQSAEIREDKSADKVAAGNDVPEASLSETYAGNNVSVEFNYPKTWKVSEAEAGLRIESPEFNYPAKSGEKTGGFRIYIRTGARSIDGKYIGRGVAIKPSEKVTYSAPALGQREQTLLSAFGLDTQDNFGFFLIAGNHQLKPGDTLGPTYGREPETYIIVGGYSGVDLKDDLATNPVDVGYYATTNAYGQAVEIIKSLKLK